MESRSQNKTEESTRVSLRMNEEHLAVPCAKFWLMDITCFPSACTNPFKKH
jgi:hypothetical protein